MIEIPLPEAPSLVMEMIKSINHLLNYETGPWIAGGVLRRILMRDFADEFDVDVFFASKEQRDKYRELIAGSASRVTLSTDVMTQEKFVRMQYIQGNHFSNYTDLLNDFDFTVCQLVSDGRTIRTSERTLRDIEQKRLSLNTNSSIRQATRLLRYFSYGFEPDETLLEAMQNANNTRYYKPEDQCGELGKQVEGIDLPLTQDIILSRVTGLHFNHYQNRKLVFIAGVPFPVQLGFLYLACPTFRTPIKTKLSAFWEKQGVDMEFFTKQVDTISVEQFLRQYRAIL